jgi:hypothetical protein
VKAERPNLRVVGRGSFETLSSEEAAAGRGMLTAVVVRKYGDKKPGPGFFELAKHLGRDTNDTDTCWIEELNIVYAIWSRSGGEVFAR